MDELYGISQPRFTGMLRTLFRDEPLALPQFVARDEALRARASRPQLNFLNKRGPASAMRGLALSRDARTLHFSYFEDLMDGRTKNTDYPRIHKLYRQLIRLTQTGLRSDGIDSDELHATAYTCYRIARADYGSVDDLKAQLKRHSMELSDADLKMLVEVARELHLWRSSKLEATEKLNPQKSTQETFELFEPTPFGGAAIAFKYEPNYFSDDESNVSGSEIDVLDLTSDGSDYGSLLSAMDTTPIKIDRMWLREESIKYIKSNADTGMSIDECVESLLHILTSPQSEAELQENLTNVLGTNGLDFAMRLIATRPKLLQSIAAEYNKIGTSAATTPFSNITVQRSSDREFDKKRERERKRLLKLAAEATKQLEKSREQLQALQGGTQAASKAPFDLLLARKRRIQMLMQANKPEKLKPKQTNESDYMRPSSIVPGAKRTDELTYESHFVPCPPPPTPSETDKLLTIEDHFEPFARLAFAGTKTLNRIQSRVYRTAYRTNNNMLICAPTGAGKTNIAMMAILREIGEHIGDDGVIRLDEFKIVYVAPMKALAAEMTASFGTKLMPLNVRVRELTGDMQLTKKEIQETQIIVTTPEKWDVITRKSSDNSLALLVRLLIIDEVHLLHEDRGAVIESLVARTLRQVEQTQSMIRIVGLSATLPNYRDVAQFLRVDPDDGLFYFDGSYRPVPMSQEFIGAKTNPALELDIRENMNEICYNRMIKSIREGNQVMIFVHSRKDTVLTAQRMLEMTDTKDREKYFRVPTYRQDYEYKSLRKQFSDSKNRELGYLFPDGIGFHNAGMLRSDRNLVEKAFSLGYIRLLVCTATLAWGVNLPAHTVIIKGTQVYAPEKGGFVDLGVLDILQIFGRAGRPQFDTSGEAILITSIDRLAHYLRLMATNTPLESSFISRLVDHLNAEIVLGTVTNVRDAVQWLSYTYLCIRMNKNPLAYGISAKEHAKDRTLWMQQVKLIRQAATMLDKCKMIRYDTAQETFHSTDLGRTASHFYIQYETVILFNEFFNTIIDRSRQKPKSSQIFLGERQNEHVTVISREEIEEQQARSEGLDWIDPRNINMSHADLIAIVSQAAEFTNVRTRDEEMDEIERLEKEAPLDTRDGDKSQLKVNVLIQAYISQTQLQSFSLASDMAYVSQNTGRIFRALFEITLKRNWPHIAYKVLQFCKMVEHRIWLMAHPLRQFNMLSPNILMRLEEKSIDIDRLLDSTAEEIAQMVHANVAIGKKVHAIARNFPRLNVTTTVQPITRTVIKLHLTITADFVWNEKIHGSVEPWHIWIEDAGQSCIYHSEYFLLHHKQKYEPQHMTLIVPIEDPPPSQYQVRILSDRWLGAETVEPIFFDNLVLPHEYPPHTALLPLQPLQLQCLQNPKFESMYNFTHFNAVQTQVFHTMYHTDSNVLLGAPTGSGKTIVAELAMLKLFRDYPHLKVVYIAPLKALVRERMRDWQKRLVGKLGKKLVELTGDYTPDIQSLMTADVVTTTPEKWDGISRNWQQRDYVQKVGLVIIDEIHLLGEDRGPILEVIVSRMRYIASVVDVPIRLVGLSTALANALDLADWLGIDRFAGLYNFRPSVRPVRLEVHISGFRGKHYCPRMATMNKPTFNAIKTYSRDKPALVFVSSRRQTRLTAVDLIAYCASDEDPRMFLHIEEWELERAIAKVKDATLKHTLSFGIGLHHAGLPEDDKVLVEDLFAANKIQVLVSTATLAWGVNLPAHLVVIKGTEFYDAETKRYVDYPITDVLQMMGRAGRPQFDTEGFACVFVEESKKPFYTKFLYEPFPVESQLKDSLHDHMNAEIVAGTIRSKQDAVDYLTWTFFFRRLLKNPSYYGLENTQSSTINKYLSDLVDKIMDDLKRARCISVDEFGANDMFVPLNASGSVSQVSNHAGTTIVSHNLGKVASYYYLHYTTMQVFRERLSQTSSLKEVLEIMCDTHEFSELPVRHNEDGLNAQLASRCNWPPTSPMDSPHTKSNLLIQAHLSHLELPISDFVTDTRQVLDQTVRVSQAMVDVCAESGWLRTALNCIHLLQMCIQGRWNNDSTLAFLPGLDSEKVLAKLAQNGITDLPQLMATPHTEAARILASVVSQRRLRELLGVLRILPAIDVQPKIHRLVLNELGQTECTLNIGLYRTSQEPNPSSGIYAPRFSKHKDEGWWVIVGNELTGELLALKKLNNTRPRMNVQLTFPVDHAEGLTLYFMSDCYIGLDQQYALDVDTK